MTDRRFFALLIVLVFFAVIATAGAEEKFGVPIYPGATPDADATQFLARTLKVNGAGYRTNDPLPKVIDFYKGQKDFQTISIWSEGATFEKGEYIDVTIQNPWMNMNTDKLINDTLISIVSRQKAN